MNNKRLPAEWEPQAFVQLTWPHEGTDWKDVLPEVEECYRRIAIEILKREPLLIVTAEDRDPLQDINWLDLNDDDEEMPPYFFPYYIVHCPTNDTWARDHAFITLVKNGECQLLDFQFNGWGMKFAAGDDNQINSYVWAQEASRLLRGPYSYKNQLDFVLEGGSIESDGRGTILTTTSCLLSKNRNESLKKKDVAQELRRRLSCSRILWLQHGCLAGDDTDGHIDTLARLCPNDTIAYVRCEDPLDEHYEVLEQMEAEIEALRTREKEPYRLVALPMPKPIYDSEGNRLPATYANFLVVNGAVLYPTYNQPEQDALAACRLQLAFPDHEIVGIDCSVLILQHGSLHCATMQYPLPLD